MPPREHTLPPVRPWTPGQVRVIARLEHGQWRTARQLADELGQRRASALTRLLGTLATQDILETSPPTTPHDREPRYRFPGWAALRARGVA